MSDSCPVCYERFDDTVVSRKLRCNDILCTSCIEGDLFDGSFFCPECGQEMKGDSIDDFSDVITIHTSHSNPEPVIVKPPTHKPRSQTLSDFTKVNPSVSTLPEFSKPRNSSLECFIQSNPTEKTARSYSVDSTTPRGQRNSDPFRFGACKEENCSNKACATDGYCLNHSSKKRTVVKEEITIADALANTPLDFVTLKGTSLHLKDRNHIWPDVIPEDLERRLRNQERLEMGEAMELINRAKTILSREPNVLRLDAPLMAVGDIHGQFYDLLNIWEVGGAPRDDNVYLFLGDYVDRGSFSCEVILTLLAYKVAYPDKVWLIRGNHECASVSGHFGFKEECKMKYGVQVYYRFLLLFQTLPLAAVVSTAYGDLFACHGGISPRARTIEDIEKIDRFVEPEESPILLDILWSDPVNEDRVAEMTDEEYSDFISIDWKANPTRGCSYCYGYRAVNDFLCENNLVTIVRAHEVQELGYHKHFDPAYIEERMRHANGSSTYRRRISPRRSSLESVDMISHTEKPIASKKPFSYAATEHSDGGNEIDESGATENGAVSDDWYHPSDDIPTVITVFSAPNYCDRYANKAAILKIDISLNGFKVLQYECVEHPKPEITESQMNNHILAVIAICPYMPTSFRDFVRVALELGPEQNLLEEIEEDCKAPDEEEGYVADYNRSDSSFSFGSPVHARKENSSLSDDYDDLCDTPPSESKTATVVAMLDVSVDEEDRVEISDKDTTKSAPEEVTITPPSVSSSKGYARSASAEKLLFGTIGDGSEDVGCVARRASDNDSGVSEYDFKRPQLASRRSEPVIKARSEDSESGGKSKPRRSLTSFDDITGVSLSGVFSPQEVKKRSNSIKKERRAISLISKPTDDMHHRSRSLSEEAIKSAYRRSSTHARLEGNGKAQESFYLGPQLSPTNTPSAAPSLSVHFVHFEHSCSSPQRPIPGGVEGNRSAVRASISMGHFSRYKSHILRSNAFTQAHASDAINELHPDQLAKFMKNISHSFELREEEKPATPVIELKRRFESRKLDPENEIARQPRMSSARQELQAFEEDVRRGRAQTVSSLRTKFDLTARENASRVLNNPSAKFRRRSASLQPLTECEQQEDVFVAGNEKRGRRSSTSGIGDAVVRAQSHSPVPSACAIFDKPEEDLPTKRRPRAAAVQLQAAPFNSSSQPLPTPTSVAVVLTSSSSADSSDSNARTPNEVHTPEEVVEAVAHNATMDKDFWYLTKYKPDSDKKVNFTHTELLALRLLFSLFDRSGSSMIGYEDLVAYGEETEGLSGIRDAAEALEIVDIDGDGKIGLLDFIHFAARLQLMYQKNLMTRVLNELTDTVNAAMGLENSDSNGVLMDEL